ncbi:5-(carboxyamino)imidazole ribonucleotide synthase [Humidisolicoccus flavus]|uniref:5-(carboxyamino)imidazole ribonucleotide synthase n=1 Tax=Humidisolicoccus flavus TaxID=3111414 RepID=UPI003247B0C9
MILGVIGGGQLARMMIPPAVALGVEIRVLAEAPEMSASLAATAVGDYRDLKTVLEFARTVDVVTFDHEHVPQSVLQALEAEGVAVHPGSAALQFAQNKLLMRERMAELGLPQPEFRAVQSADDVEQFLREHSGAGVLKTATGGYDGKGVMIVRDADDARDWIEQSHAGGPELLIEELVEFKRELALLSARSVNGEIAAWPLVQTVQQNGICAEVLAPAPGAGESALHAEEIARTIIDALGVTGVLAVEMFEASDGRLLINELAMRPHNSGHWTIDGSTTSQFEQHIRAVLGLPLGATGMHEPVAVMINVIGGPASGRMEHRYAAALADQPIAKFHSYSKTARPGRKVGHVTVVGDDLDLVCFQARAAAAFFEN